MQMTTRACSYERMNIERLGARVFVALGGAFWAVAQFGGLYFYRDLGLAESIGGALPPLAISAAALAVGWFYERLAAIGLGVGAAAIVVWGVLAGWEVGSWLGMVATVVGPMTAAAVLFWLAARMEEICGLEEESRAGD